MQADYWYYVAYYVGLYVLYKLIQRLFFWRATRVIDGDTVDFSPPLLSRYWGKVRVRFYAMDANELRQPGGQWAKQWVQRKMGGKYWRLAEIKSGAYGRKEAKIRSIWLNRDYIRVMLKAGVGTLDPRYVKKRDKARYTSAMASAQRWRRGRWSRREWMASPKRYR